MSEPAPLLSIDPEAHRLLREKIAETREDIKRARIAARSVPGPTGARPTPPPTVGEQLQVLEDRVRAVETLLVGAMNVADRLGQLEEMVLAADERLTKAADWVAAILKALERKKIAVVRPHPRARKKKNGEAAADVPPGAPGQPGPSEA